MKDYSNNDITIPTTHSLNFFEMGRMDVDIVCTYGKISIWFGRSVPDDIIKDILIIISNVDKSTVHECEFFCEYEEITEYENNGYILVSYARSGNKYRATFNVPFSNDMALHYLTSSIKTQLNNEDVNINLYWTGDNAGIVQLYEKLKTIQDWKIKQINYKDDGKDYNLM